MSSDRHARACAPQLSIRLLLWTLAWSGSMVLVDKAILYSWYSSPAVSVAGVIVNAGLGLGMIWAFLRYLSGIDELQRKIQVDALAIAMGVGLVSSFSYSLLVTAGLVTDPEVSDIILAMTGTHVAAIPFGQYRYR